MVMLRVQQQEELQGLLPSHSGELKYFGWYDKRWTDSTVLTLRVPSRSDQVLVCQVREADDDSFYHLAQGSAHAHC